MTLPSTTELNAEWSSAQLLYSLYTTLAREFTIDLEPSTELEAGGDNPPPDAMEAARIWLRDADKRIPVHQMRQFLQTSRLADEKLCAPPSSTTCASRRTMIPTATRLIFWRFSCFPFAPPRRSKIEP